MNSNSWFSAALTCVTLLSWEKQSLLCSYHVQALCLHFAVSSSCEVERTVSKKWRAYPGLDSCPVGGLPPEPAHLPPPPLSLHACLVQLSSNCLLSTWSILQATTTHVSSHCRSGIICSSWPARCCIAHQPFKSSSCLFSLLLSPIQFSAATKMCCLLVPSYFCTSAHYPLSPSPNLRLSLEPSINLEPRCLLWLARRETISFPLSCGSYCIITQVAQCVGAGWVLLLSAAKISRRVLCLQGRVPQLVTVLGPEHRFSKSQTGGLFLL